MLIDEVLILITTITVGAFIFLVYTRRKHP